MQTKLIKIVHELREASGSNKKLEILRKYKNNDLWLIFLRATYDMRIVYYVSAPVDYNFDVVDIDNDLFSGLLMLSSRVVTGKEAKVTAKKLSKKYGEIARLVLGRSIKAGVSTATINKAYDNMIPVFKSMKGKDVPIVEYPVFSSIKYDGVKVFAFVRPNSLKFTTSSGAEFVCTWLKKEFEYTSYGVYEGELTYKEGKQVHRPVITGKLNSLLSGSTVDMTDCYYRIYDCIDLEEWDKKKSNTPFYARQAFLNIEFDKAFKDSKMVKQVENELLPDIHSVEDTFFYLITQGYEGSMHRYGEDVYQWNTSHKRCERLIKKKAIRECILTCVGVVPHSNPNKGNIGALICEGNVEYLKGVGRARGEAVEVKVKVGSGLSKMDILHDPGYFIGEKIEVIYNSVTLTNGNYSLFLPRFKRISR